MYNPRVVVIVTPVESEKPTHFENLVIFILAELVDSYFRLGERGDSTITSMILLL
jgi:hypothetical protein